MAKKKKENGDNQDKSLETWLWDAACAIHGVDLGLVFGNPRDPIAGNTAEARKMAEIVGSAFVSFSKTGNPNCNKIPDWQAYNSESRATMIFDLECRAENDPTSELRLLWNSALT